MFRRMDLLLLGITIGLTLFGLAMIASVSVYESYVLTSQMVQNGQLAAPNNYFYLWRDTEHVAMGLVVMFLTMSVPYRRWERLAKPFFIISVLLLIFVFIPKFGNNYGSAGRWINLGPVSLQPSEIMKLALVFYLAVWLQKREQLIGTFKEGFIPFAILLLLSACLVAIQPDLGSFLVIVSIATTMFFIAGGNIIHLFTGGLLATVFGLPLILEKQYVRDRFIAWFSPSNPTISQTVGFQINQALIGIGSGGPFGVGYGQSIQKFGYLPEVQSDMIFAAMGEELGFFRLLIILTMYAILILRGYKIAREAPDRFGFLVATGITTWIAFQTIINVAVNLSLFPLTGITLPFISYGGTSLIMLMAGIGILLNISTYSTEGSLAERRPKRKWRLV